MRLGHRVTYAATHGDELPQLCCRATDELAGFEESYAGSSCSLPVGAAIPKKTRTARFSRTISSSARRPTHAPIFVFGTVVTLSAIKRHSTRSPLFSLGLMRSRKRGASVGSVVNAHTVTESVMTDPTDAPLFRLLIKPSENNGL